MKLIDKLGGYENAKKLRGTTSNALLDMKTWTVHVDDIDKELLEYRREHNIFELGDMVTYKAYFKGGLREGFGVITDIDEGLEWVTIDDKILVAIDEISHATDAEIQAGHRL